MAEQAVTQLSDKPSLLEALRFLACALMNLVSMMTWGHHAAADIWIRLVVHSVSCNCHTVYPQPLSAQGLRLVEHGDAHMESSRLGHRQQSARDQDLLAHAFCPHTLPVSCLSLNWQCQCSGSALASALHIERRARSQDNAVSVDFRTSLQALQMHSCDGRSRKSGRAD